MSKLIIKKYQYNNRKNEPADKKWFGRVAALETVDLDGICEHIVKHGTIYTADIVYGVVKNFVTCIQELLLESKKVKLNGLGTFYLSCKSIGVDEADDFEPRKHIKNLMVRFTGDRSKKSVYKKSALMDAAHLTNLDTLGFMPLADDGSSSSGGNNSDETASDEP